MDVKDHYIFFTATHTRFMKVSITNSYLFNRNSLIVYYKAIMSFMVSGTNKSLSTISSSSSADNKKRLLVWNTAIKNLHTLVMMLKYYYAKQMLSTCLKVGMES